MATKSKAERIGEVLQSLAYRDFEVCGSAVYITDYDGGRLADERRVSANVERQSEQHVLLHHGVSSEGQDVADDWCPECTRELLSSEFGPSADLLAVLEEFSDGFKRVSRKESAAAMLMSVLRFLDESHEQEMRAATMAVCAREQLIPDAEALEKIFANWSSDDDRVADFYLVWLGTRFHRIVDRAEALNVISANLSASESVQRYLLEASRCYLFGQYTACLVMCRAAIELALGEFLDRHGFRAELQKLGQERRDGLWARIDLAKRLNTWKLNGRLDAALDWAEHIRDLAGTALHRRAVEPTDCKDLYDKARRILHELYT